MFLIIGYVCDGQTVHSVSNDLTSNVTAETLIQVTPSYVSTKLSPPSILRRGSRHKRRRTKTDELNSSSDFILPDEHPISKHMVSD